MATSCSRDTQRRRWARSIHCPLTARVFPDSRWQQHHHEIHSLFPIPTRFPPETVQIVRAAFFRNVFFYGEAQNHTPASDFGFGYAPTLGVSAGPPFLNINGYAALGNPITGPQNTYQNDYQGSYSLAMTLDAIT